MPVSIAILSNLKSAIQDTNNNGKMDTNFLGIPKEPSGISKWGGKGPPGNYKKHKVNLNTTDTVKVELHKF